MRSERALEGDIERVGGQFRIRRGSSESWIPGDQAIRLCADWDEALAYMKSRANLGDPDEHLRLARWCQLHQLDGPALNEARAALDLRPDQAATKQLVILLERRVTEAAPKPATPPAVVAAGPTPSVDLSPESMVAFKTRVQPILMNACASCHTTGYNGAFRLYRVTEGGQHTSTRRNLAAVLAQANLEHPPLSPLLVKAFSPHGGAAQPPLKGKDSTPFRLLQEWIDQTAATNPHLRRTGPAPLPAGIASSAQPLPTPLSTPMSAPSAPEGAVQAPANSDPFAPEAFNEQSRPKN
jgi:hypothetical protein